MQQNDYVSDASDDIIIFKKNKYCKETKWRFPQAKQCPHSRCKKKFLSRALTIKHFREEHSGNTKFCKSCDKLVSANKFKRHIESTNHLSLASKIKPISVQVKSVSLKIIPIWNIQLDLHFLQNSRTKFESYCDEFNFFVFRFVEDFITCLSIWER